LSLRHNPSFRPASANGQKSYEKIECWVGLALSADR
jgi:hypothetical protein